MCACRCGIRVTLRDGEVRHIEGNPEHPLNKGVICAKGASGIMKQYSPARLTKPLLRRKHGKRGDSDFEEISWDQAFKIMEERLGRLRAEDPKQFALFTGRDQMQALTGMFAKQFGTPNYAAHGGFCSVNMAAGLIYTIGGSFWEFGGPDLDRAKLFVMIGTAEDHHSNPLKVAISKFKRRGGTFHLDQPGAHRLLGDRRRVGADQARYRRRPDARDHPRDHQAGPVRPRLPGRLHQCRRADQSRPGVERLRHVHPHQQAGRRRLFRCAEQAVVGPQDQRAGRRALRGL
jgi:hypothetical protein